jgi:hypothetical protein
MFSALESRWARSMPAVRAAGCRACRASDGVGAGLGRAALLDLPPPAPLASLDRLGGAAGLLVLDDMGLLKE